MKRVDYAAAMRRAIVNAEVEEGRGGTRVFLDCQRCGRIEAFHSTKRLPPDVIAAKLARNGWSLGNRHHECPNHGKQRETDQMPANDKGPALKVVAQEAASDNAMAVAHMAATDRAKAAKRDAMRWLDEAFDPSKGTYAPGVNDDTIAKETGLAVAAVTNLREEFFGPLKAPGEFADLQAEQAALNARADELRDSFEIQLRLLRDGIETLGKRLIATAQKNGWK